MVSDLGVSDTNAQYFFNYGCAAAGIIIYIYGILTAYFSKSAFDRISYILIALAGMFLIGVGTFTEDLGWPHNLCAYSLFIAVAVSAIIRLVLDIIHRDTICSTDGSSDSVSSYRCSYADISLPGSICNYHHSDLDCFSVFENDIQK